MSCVVACSSPGISTLFLDLWLTRAAVPTLSQMCLYQQPKHVYQAWRRTWIRERIALFKSRTGYWQLYAYQNRMIIPNSGMHLLALARLALLPVG